MDEIASRELRNNTKAVLDRVADGEEITVTVAGRPVALIAPVRACSRWIGRDRFVRDVLIHGVDPGLTADLAPLGGETTDDLPPL